MDSKTDKPQKEAKAGMKSTARRGIGLAVLAAALYALNAPFSKLLLADVPSTLMAGLLYLGAGLGMGVMALLRRITGRGGDEKKLAWAQLPYTVAMIVLDILAPIFLLLGLSQTTAAHASLLNNFEIVTTAVIAFAVFKEKISLRLWLGILFVTLSCCMLSFVDIQSLKFSSGSLYVLLAACCWGLENNCTRKISSKDPLQIVLLKGIFSGLGSVQIGLFLGERIEKLWCIPLVLLLGFVAYGLSIYFYVYAQRMLGAAKTSAYYAIAPFIGVLLSFVIFQAASGTMFFAALALMMVGTWLASQDTPLSEVFCRKHSKRQ